MRVPRSRWCSTVSAATPTSPGRVDRGWFLSSAGNVTYPKNAYLREAVAAAPLERILVETDSPFLAPQRLRGRDNVPANVVDAIEQIAGVRGEPVENVRARPRRTLGSPSRLR